VSVACVVFAFVWGGNSLRSVKCSRSWICLETWEKGNTFSQNISDKILSGVHIQHFRQNISADLGQRWAYIFAENISSQIFFRCIHIYNMFIIRYFAHVRGAHAVENYLGVRCVLHVFDTHMHANTHTHKHTNRARAPVTCANTHTYTYTHTHVRALPGHIYSGMHVPIYIV